MGMKNILIINSKTVHIEKLMVTCVKKNNYTTFETRNGIQALDIINKQYIDLVISDKEHYVQLY